MKIKKKKINKFHDNIGIKFETVKERKQDRRDWSFLIVE